MHYLLYLIEPASWPIYIHELQATCWLNQYPKLDNLCSQLVAGEEETIPVELIGYHDSSQRQYSTGTHSCFGRLLTRGTVALSRFVTCSIHASWSSLAVECD